ncbi:MAG TPA: hypothetical protein VFS37_03655 [Conexibacter sp.]|nr:hypothetical protein [Conexibacter sp.]
MARMQSIGRWIGSLSSAGVVAGSYGAATLVALLFARHAAVLATAVGVGLVVVYALLRPTRRGDVLSAALFPAVASNLAHEVFGVPHAWVGWPLALLVVAGLAYEDREEDKAARV